MTLDIIIPVRNCPARVVRLLNSLVRDFQNESRAKAILVDDASDDDTPKVIEEFCARYKDKFSAIYSKEQGNAGGARNVGALHSNADYLAFFDADDDIAVDSVKKICDALETNKPELLMWGFVKVAKKGRSIWLPDFKDKRDFCKSPCAPWIKSVRRDLFVKFDERVYCEDCPWWFRTADKVNPEKVFVIHEPIYIYDRREACFSNTLEFFSQQPFTLEYLAFSNLLINQNMNDRAPSDCLRNLAALYDLRHELKNDYVKQVWAGRFHNDYCNILSGRWSF